MEAVVDIQKLGLELIREKISKDCKIFFKENWFTFYLDDNGQRGHYILPYKPYGTGKQVGNQYVIKRVLSFTNKEDEGKEKAVLGVINLDKCEVVSIHCDKVEFKDFVFMLTGNNSTRSSNFKYEW